MAKFEVTNHNGIFYINLTKTNALERLKLTLRSLYRGSTRIFEIYNLEVGLSMFYDNTGGKL
ncbi:UNVERIFIED_CONTAM: hypothetical protein NCL1_49687 [Trichonephila clavipes]